ncbi:MAG TPA: biotin/lipoyl-containing protein, partial [Caulobacteraceae bacterium]|nr:biotin/lipoyl-containing protein [Caulobacteraceae bacterium]
MADIMTPALGESVTEATVARWTKKPGEAVKKDEILVELETDKVSLEVASPSDGVLSEIAANDGETVTPGALLGRVSEGAAASAPKPGAQPEPQPGTATSVAPAGEAQAEAQP